MILVSLLVILIFYCLLLSINSFFVVMCMTTDRSHLTSVERSIDISIKELDKRIVKFLTEPPPQIDKNVQANAAMNVLLFRYIVDYFNYLNGIGDMLLEDNEDSFRLLNEIGLEGPEFIKLDMDKKAWNSIAKLYDYHEGEIEEMVSTVGSTKLMWDSMRKELEWYLEMSNPKRKSN